MGYYGGLKAPARGLYCTARTAALLNFNYATSIDGLVKRLKYLVLTIYAVGGPALRIYVSALEDSTDTLGE
jgi:hypothetical protein